ncbi:hypothetical protein CR513_27538, partial [Mucuna pruriens]
IAVAAANGGGGWQQKAVGGGRRGWVAADGGDNTPDDGPQLWVQAELCSALIPKHRSPGSVSEQPYSELKHAIYFKERNICTYLTIFKSKITNMLGPIKKTKKAQKNNTKEINDESLGNCKLDEDFGAQLNSEMVGLLDRLAADEGNRQSRKLDQNRRQEDRNQTQSYTIVDSDSKAVVSVIDLGQISTTDIGTYDVVVLPSFVPSMDTYVHILTKMARQSVNGVLHSFLTERDAELAAPLIAVLEQCGQEVPQTLQDLHHTSNMLED